MGTQACPSYPDQVVGAGSEKRTLAFRYDITSRTKLNAFKPKKVEEDFLNVRYSQFGGCFDSYNTMLKSPNAAIVWEAGLVTIDETKRVTWNGLPSQSKPLKVKISDAVPAVITPVKPKFFLLCKTTVKAHTAVRLK